MKDNRTAKTRSADFVKDRNIRNKDENAFECKECSPQARLSTRDKETISVTNNHSIDGNSSNGERVKRMGAGCIDLQECRMYRGIVESARDAVVTIDENHRIVFFNKAAVDMFGYSKEEIVSEDLSILIPDEHKAAHRDYVRRYVESRKGRFMNHTVALEAQKRSGDGFPASVSFSESESENRLLMTAMIRDMSEIKALERTALQNERLASMGKAVSFIAHEIKNPLIVIGGLARNMLKKTEADEEFHKRLHIIEAEVQRLERLLGDVQDFSKPLESSKKKKVRLDKLLSEIIDPLKESDLVRGKHLSLDASCEVTVSLDPDRFHQVLLNVVKNALEAVQDSGTVEVELGVGAKTVFVDVRDNGAGIPEDRRQSIFEPFVTGKNSGLGLGLPLSRKIAREHGGDLTVHSRPGEGCLTRITLPKL